MVSPLPLDARGRWQVRGSLGRCARTAALALPWLPACAPPGPAAHAEQVAAADAAVPAPVQIMGPAPITEPVEVAEPARSGPDAGAESAASSAFCAASRVLREHCVGCHNDPPVAAAPMPLVEPAQLLARSPYRPDQTVLERVRQRIHDARDPMPPQGLLDAAALAPLEAWLAAGPAVQAASTPCAEPTVSAQPPAWPADCESIYTLRSHDPDDPSKPFRVPAGQELRQGVAVEAPWGDTPVQALMIRPLIDNAKVVHHWVFASGEPDTQFENWLWGWAPGGGASVALPDDVGMYLPPGLINLNMHYYNFGDRDEFDMSGLEICTTSKFRKYTATMGMDFNAFPLGIPPNQRSDVEDVCRLVTTGDEDIHVLALLPHMHKLGVHMFVSVTHDGAETVLHDGPFRFVEQRLVPLQDVVIRNGDVVRTRCTYENDTQREVSVGESTDQEMCVSFALHWPMEAYFCLPF